MTNDEKQKEIEDLKQQLEKKQKSYTELFDRMNDRMKKDSQQYSHMLQMETKAFQLLNEALSLHLRSRAEHDLWGSTKCEVCRNAE